MFAAFHIPQFAMAAGLLDQPEWRRRPCVILAGREAGAREEKLPVLAVNRAAREAGIETGWPLSRAWVRCPDLRVIARNPGGEVALTEALFKRADALAPDVEMTAVDAVVVDLATRCGVEWERSGGEFFPEGVECWWALAGTPDLALLAARHEVTCGRRVVPEDLAALPLEMLEAWGRGAGALPVLELWGVRTLGDFMRLPRQALTERLGPEAGHWHDLLHGKVCRLLRLHRPPESLVQVMDFEDPVVSVEPLVFAVKRMLHTLAGRLASRHLAVGWLEIQLCLEAGGEVSRQIRLPEAQTAVEGMLAPLQAFLESLQTAGGVVAVRLDVGTTFALARQREWYGRQLPQPERWAETLATLEALVGSGQVGTPVHGNSHRPDHFVMHSVASGEAVRGDGAFHPLTAMPLHRFRPPRPVAVVHEAAEGVVVPLALLNGPFPGEIVGRRGPFVLSGEWWSPGEAWQRLEWDVQVASRHLVRLVMEGPERWQLEGIYR